MKKHTRTGKQISHDNCRVPELSFMVIHKLIFNFTNNGAKVYDYSGNSVYLGR